MHACYMTLTYLRGGLSICSVVWVSVQYFFLKFIKFLMQLCKISSKDLKITAQTFFFCSCLRLRNSFWESAPVAVVCDFTFWSKNDNFYRLFVNFLRFDYLNC